MMPFQMALTELLEMQTASVRGMGPVQAMAGVEEAEFQKILDERVIARSGATPAGRVHEPGCPEGVAERSPGMVDGGPKEDGATAVGPSVGEAPAAVAVTPATSRTPREMRPEGERGTGAGESGDVSGGRAEKTGMGWQGLSAGMPPVGEGAGQPTEVVLVDKGGRPVFLPGGPVATPGEGAQGPMRGPGRMGTSGVESVRAATGSSVAKGQARGQGMEAVKRPVDTRGPNFADELADRVGRLRLISRPGMPEQVRIALDPEELGSVSMRLMVDAKNKVNLLIVTESEAARELLTSRLSELKESLAGQGLGLGEIEVQVDDREGREEPGWLSRRREKEAGEIFSLDGGRGSAPAVTSARWPTMVRGGSGLSLFA
ncbi:MAG: flagellar hook-length control protein FliK [Magnetococcales bacterium]|nr:flagellar hook-length control protein FliK [Magnetococcales bacterium]MBF0155692.1 flagellar hook-length control protein FliK [Magnetococcales bacterium]